MPGSCKSRINESLNGRKRGTSEGLAVAAVVGSIASAARDTISHLKTPSKLTSVCKVSVRSSNPRDLYLGLVISLDRLELKQKVRGRRLDN